MSFSRLQRSLNLLAQINKQGDSRSAICKLLGAESEAFALKDQHLYTRGAGHSHLRFASLAQPEVFISLLLVPVPLSLTLAVSPCGQQGQQLIENFKD